MWHMNMTWDEMRKENEKFRTQEVRRLRGLAAFYNAEADKLEKKALPAKLEEGNTDG
jgi:hypothetical protein